MCLPSPCGTASDSYELSIIRVAVFHRRVCAESLNLFGVIKFVQIEKFLRKFSFSSISSLNVSAFYMDIPSSSGSLYKRRVQSVYYEM